MTNNKVAQSGITCSECSQCYNGKNAPDVKNDETLENVPKWKCGKCSKKPLTSSNTVAATNGLKLNGKKPVRTYPNINDVYSMFMELKKDLKSFQSGLVESIKKLQAKIEANAECFDEQNRKLKQCFETIGSLKKENEELRRDIEVIKKKQTESDQRMRCNDLEIRGIPVQPNENVICILQSLAMALQCRLLIDENCIVFCYRANSKEDGVPGTIFVRFNHHAFKNDLLRRRCAVRGFSSRLMQLPVTSDMSVFVNESLCPERRVLFKKANEIRKQKKYRYIWTREGRILVRQSDKCSVMAINCLADLDKL
uniref:FP protein C-terminal domain-containing protein n=1 Tax=Lygus hesperus TaxID=30085 RepID=A0A146LHH6_LYGHE